jgi:hypothetical protein
MTQTATGPERARDKAARTVRAQEGPGRGPGRIRKAAAGEAPDRRQQALLMLGEETGAASLRVVR